MLDLYINYKLTKNYFFKDNFFIYKITSSSIVPSIKEPFKNKIKNSNFVIINKLHYNCNNALVKVRLYSTASYEKTSVNLNELEHLSQIFFDRYSDRINMKTFYAKLQKKYITKIYFFDTAINFGGKTFFVKYSSLLLKNINSQFFINIWETTNLENDNGLVGLNLNSKIQNSFFKKWIFYFNSFFKTKKPFLVSFSKKRIKSSKKWKIYFKKRKKLLLFANYVRFLSNLNQVKYFRILFNDLFFARNFFFEKQIISGNFLLFFDNNFKNISNFLNNFLSNYILFEKYLLFFISQKNLFFLFNTKGKYYQNDNITPKFKQVSLMSHKNLEIFSTSYESPLVLDEQQNKKWLNFLSGKLEIMDNQFFFNNKLRTYNFFWKYKKKKRINFSCFKSILLPNRHFFWKSNVSPFFSNFSFSDMRSLPLYIRKFFAKGGRSSSKNKKKKANFFIRGRDFIGNFFNNKFFYEKTKQKANILNFLGHILTLRLSLKRKQVLNTSVFLNKIVQFGVENNFQSSQQNPFLKRDFVASKIRFKHFYLGKHKKISNKVNSSLGISTTVFLTSPLYSNNFFKTKSPIFKTRIFEKLKKKYFRKYFELSARVFTLFKQRYIKSKFYKPLISFLGNLKQKWFFLYKNLKMILLSFFCKKEYDKNLRSMFSFKTVYFYVLFIGLHFFFKFINFISFFNFLKLKMISNFEKKELFINKIFSSIKFIKKKLFNLDGRVHNIFSSQTVVFLNNFFSKSSAVLFFRNFSFMGEEKSKQYSDFLKKKITSFLISPRVLSIFNYKYSEDVFCDDIKEQYFVGWCTSFKQILKKNYKLAFLQRVPVEIFSHASQYLKKFNYFYFKRALDKKKRMYRIKRKKKRLKLFWSKKINKRRRDNFLKFKRKKKGIVLNKKNVFYANRPKNQVSYVFKNKISQKSKEKKKIFVKKKYLRNFFLRFLKKSKKLNKLKKIRLKKLFNFFAKIFSKGDLNKNKYNKFLSARLLERKNYPDNLVIKYLTIVEKKKLGINGQFKIKNKIKAKLNKKRRIYNFPKIFLKMLQLRSKREFLNALMQWRERFSKIINPKEESSVLVSSINDYIDVLRGKAKISSKKISQLICLNRRYLSFFNLCNKAGVSLGELKNSHANTFLVKNRYIFRYLRKNIKLFLKIDPFFVKYVNFFKNIIYNFSFNNNLKNLKQYLKKKHIRLYQANLRKKKKENFSKNKVLAKFFKSKQNLNMNKKKITLKKLNIIRVIVKFFRKVERTIKRTISFRRKNNFDNIDNKKIEKRIYWLENNKNIKKFVFKKLLLKSVTNFFSLNKFKKLNKKKFLEKKFKKMVIKRNVANILLPLIDIKFLSFENALGISHLLNIFNFLFLKSNLMNEFLEFFNLNIKKTKSKNLSFVTSNYFLHDLNLLFGDIIFKLYELDKNKIRIDWIILGKIFLNFFVILKKEISGKSEIGTELGKNLEMLFVFFFYNALSFIFGIFLQNKPFNFYKFTLLKNDKFNKFFEYFSNMWDFFLKNFPFNLIIVNKKNLPKRRILISAPVSNQIKSNNLTVFSWDNIVPKFQNYVGFIFNKMKDGIIKTEKKVPNINVENFIKNKYKNFFFLIVKAAKNNIFFTFLNRKGRLIKKGSGGMLGYEGPKRTTYLAAFDNIKNIVSNIILKYKIRKKYNYKHKFMQKHVNFMRKNKISTKSAKKRQIFLSIIKSFFFNVITILRSSSKNMQIKAVLESLYGSGCKIIRILNYSARSHNGCRKRKVRRL